MKRLWKYARRHKWRMVWGCMMLALTNITAAAIPQLFRVAIDAMQASDDAYLVLREAAFTLVVVAVGGALFRITSRVHLFFAARDAEMDLRCDFYEHLAGQSVEYFDTHPVGDLMSRATNDLQQIRLVLGPGVLNIVNATIVYGVTVPLMLEISPSLTAISLLIYPPALIILARLSRKLYQHNRRQQQQMGGLSAFVLENLAGSHVVRAFGLEAKQRERFETLNGSYYVANVELGWIRSYLWRLVSGWAAVGVLAAIWAGAWQVIEGTLTLGELVAFTEYLALLAWPSFAIGWIISLWQRGSASMSRLGEVLDVASNIQSGAIKTVAPSPDIRLQNLSYHIEQRAVIDDVSVHVPAGRTLGIVGSIGSGKSMLVRAMIREIGVASGSVFVGGEDVTTLELNTLRGLFGFVHQTPLLFSKTLAENVAFGDVHAGAERIREALRLAAFERDIDVLPKGLDTDVGERGVTLSGGQKQRVAIARALLLDPPVLILDDALSSVDAETEQTILSGMRRLREGRTTVIVAHRITAVEHADEIIVMHRGKVVERGTHEALLNLSGVYAGLAHMQELEQDVAGSPLEART